MAVRSTRGGARKATGYYAEDDDEDFVPDSRKEDDSDEFVPEPVTTRKKGRRSQRNKKTATTSASTRSDTSSDSIRHSLINSSTPSGTIQHSSTTLASIPNVSAAIATPALDISAAPAYPVAPTVPDYILPDPSLHNHYNIPDGEEARLANYIRSLPAISANLPINSCDICKQPFIDESPIFLPCGHIYGDSCALLMDACPTGHCKTLLNHECGHPIRFRPAYHWQKWVHQTSEIPKKCVHCTVKDIDEGINIRGYKTSFLLQKIVELEANRNQLMTMGGGIGLYSQEVGNICQELYTTRQNLQWVEKIVAEMYLAAEVYGL